MKSPKHNSNPKAKEQHYEQQQISTPRYSDITSYYLKQAAKNNKSPSNNYEYEWDNLMSSIKKNKNNNNNNNNDKKQMNNNAKQRKQDKYYRNDRRQQQVQEVYGKQITQYFYQQDDSLISLTGLLPQQQFKDIAYKQMHLQPNLTQTIANKFYSHKNKPAKSQQSQQYNKYYVQYLQWKQQQQQQKQQKQNPINKTYNIASNNNKIKNTIEIDRNIQLLRYKQKQAEENRVRCQQQVKNKLKKLSEQYHSKLHQVINNQQHKQLKQKQKQKSYKLDQVKKQAVVQKGKSMGFAHIDYPILNAVQVQAQYQMLGRRNQQKLKQINQKSFIDIIKNPPKIIPNYPESKNTINIINTDIKTSKNTKQPYEYQRHQLIQVPIQPVSIDPKQNKPKRHRPQFTLDIAQLLKIPPHKFILFFTKNQQKLTALATPSQLQQINKYRNQCIQKYQALQKLKEKIAEYGEEILQKLTKEKKEKLFQLLYAEDVQKQKQKYMLQY